MIPVIDESLSEIKRLQKEIQTANEARDYERLFHLTVQLENAVHKLNAGDSE